MIQGLLAFSRLGRGELNLAPIDMDDMAQNAVEEARLVRPKQNVSVTIEPLPPAFGDWRLVRQVLANLVGNAMKFSSHREESRIEIGAKANGRENVYYVRDNGAGFDMQHAGQLFGVFQRLHSSEEFEGTGIGLAISRRIIERHGGTMCAEGKTGEGATFYFSLPQVTGE